ncbi:MAG: MFS transporter [Nanoarchaeota archaeon]|nr:MFS transporter [Nanoarchaeota archaeon]MBU1622000.1 MFS transporter [Nanoarchaeota archaeon]
MFFNKYKIKSKNIEIMALVHLIWGLLFFLPILALYMEEHLFSVMNVALIFAISSVATIIFEIPTGAISDLFGRKNTYLAAGFFAVISIVFLYIGGEMIFFVLYAIFNALGRSLASGTDEAIIYDTLAEEKKEHLYKKIISVLAAVWPFGAIVGSIVGGYLAKVSLSFPILISFIPVTIAVFLLFFLKEPKYQKEEHRNVLKQMWNSSKVVFQNKQIFLLMLTGFILLAFGETAHILKPIFLEFKQFPIEYFGYVFGITFGLSSLGHYLSHDISEKIGDKLTIIIAAITFPLFLLLATLTEGLVILLFLVLTGFAFGLRNPVIAHLLNKEISSSKRATVLSINNMFGNFGIAIGGPFLGYFADLYNINTAFMISAGLMFTGVIVALFIKNKD